MLPCGPVRGRMLVDFEIIKRAQAGDAPAFNEIVLAYRKRTLGTIARLTVNAAYDYLRKHRRRMESRMSDLSEQQVMLADAMAGGRVDHDVRQRRTISEAVDAMLSAVSEADRILLTLKEVEGLSLKELEKIYRVKENALKVRLFRARQRVLKAFGEAGKEPSAKGAAKAEI